MVEIASQIAALGQVPATAINEASEIMQQLNHPFYKVIYYNRDKKGNIESEEYIEVTALHIILALGGPAAFYAVMKILDNAGGTGKRLFNAISDIGEDTDEAAKKARKYLESVWNLRPGMIFK